MSHLSSALSEEELALRLHFETDEIVLQWGHNPSANGADIMTYNPKANRITIFDDKARRQLKPAQLGKPKIFEGNDRALIEEALLAIPNSNMSGALKQQAQAALRDGRVRYATHGAGNYKNSVISEPLK